MLLHRIRLRNLLSFGEYSEPFDLRPLNVLIGPNGSGKSNFLDSLEILRATTKDVWAPLRRGGGAGQWLCKQSSGERITIYAHLGPDSGQEEDVYRLALPIIGGEPRAIEEEIRLGDVLYLNREGQIEVSVDSKIRETLEMGPRQSLLSQLKDPSDHSDLTALGDRLSEIRLYRDWHLGGRSSVRQPQPADALGDHLLEDASNLALVLNQLDSRPAIRKKIREWLGEVYEGLTDFHVQVQGGTVQLFVEEGEWMIPATRISDGTLRCLALLAILCHPEPPPLVCIEEPELGLHPDVVVRLADLMVEASSRTQLVVTTHSPALIDALTDRPECVVVCEKEDGQTLMRRLSAAALESWLGDYGLGELWSKGQIGGNRW